MEAIEQALYPLGCGLIVSVIPADEAIIDEMALKSGIGTRRALSGWHVADNQGPQRS